MSIVVYWLSHTGAEPAPHFQAFGDGELSKALALTAELNRQAPAVSHVTSCGQPIDLVGKLGVDSIVDGKTPDGHNYDWSKAGRAGRVRAADQTKVHVRGDDQR